VSDYLYDAELYELLHSGTPGDLAFYRELCRGTDNVLELGCGYGRVLCALAELDCQLVGMDRNGDLLTRAAHRRDALPADARRRIQLVRGDMRRFDLGRRFDRILIPYSGIYCLLDEHDCVRCLECAARRLAPGGRLIFDAYQADDFHTESDPCDYRDQTLEPAGGIDHRGVRYDVFERSSWEREQQRLDVVYECVPRGGGAVLQGAIPHRYLLSHQVEGLLARAGLRLLHLYGDYQGSELQRYSELLVAIAERAGPEPNP
jgi:SAM-dependent methyltransferase